MGVLADACLCLLVLRFTAACLLLLLLLLAAAQDIYSVKCVVHDPKSGEDI